jgi:hypothetical protein
MDAQLEPSGTGTLRMRLGRLLLAGAIVGTGIFLLSHSARPCSLEVSAGKGMRLTSMDAVVTKVPEGTLVHRASFFFSGGTDGPVLRTLHPRLEDGRRYRVEVRLSPTQPNESEGTADTLSREFLFQGQTSLRMNF